MRVHSPPPELRGPCVTLESPSRRPSFFPLFLLAISRKNVCALSLRRPRPEFQPGSPLKKRLD